MADTDKRLIECSDIKKAFGALQVLKGVSFYAKEGEVLSIIGPSGSGKSTLLRSLCQLEVVDSGSISVCGNALVTDGVYKSKKELRALTLQLGFVFQNFNLFPHYSVLQNIVEPQLKVLHRTRQEAEKKARLLLARMGLDSKEGSYPYELSGGQAQRVSIARCLALSPKVLLFDEPTSALDPELTGEVLKIIRGLAESKMTMIVVTHEIAFAKEISNYIIFLDKGVIVEKGVPEAVIGSPKEKRTQEFLRRFSSISK